MQRRVPIWLMVLGCFLSLLVGVGIDGLSRATSIHPSAELAASSSFLKAGEMQSAYDALLSAMRVSPDDARVFYASLEFVRKASKNDNDEAFSLAQDVLQRSASMMPFLPLERLKAARTAHTQAGDELFATKSVASPEDPFAEAEILLRAAQQAHLPNFARARLLHEVEAELSSQVRRVASTMIKPMDDDHFWKRWKSVKASYDETQKAVLSALYQEDCRPRILAWAKKVEEFKQQSASAGLTEVHRANEELLGLIIEGQRISRDLTPFLEGGVDAAMKDNQDGGPERHLNQLAQLREWNYNRWALDRVEKVEQSGGSALEKLRSLSIIDETRLAPYVGQCFAEGWKSYFEQCSKEEKVVATKLRILREYQP